MQLKEYEIEAVKFATYLDPMYLYWGLRGEAGEIQGKFAKRLRGDKIENFQQALVLECGDCLWHMALMCHDLDLQISDFYSSQKAKLSPEKAADLMYRAAAYISQSFADRNLDPVTINISLHYLESICGEKIETIAKSNIEKLSDRKARDMIRGDGDYR